MLKCGFAEPFRAQAEVLDAFFGSTRDICIGHPTGSGKTLAYLLAAITRICRRVVPRIRVAIIVPNKTLAMQVLKVGADLLVGTDLSIGILGQAQSAFDVMIATAGRVAEFIVERDAGLLRFVEVLVIDEGDLVLAQPIESFAQHLCQSLVAVGDSLVVGLRGRLGNLGSPGRRVRRIICSATVSRRPGQADALGMVRPLLLAEGEGRYVAPAGVVEEFVVCKSIQKLGLLIAAWQRWARILCFVSSERRMGIVASCLGGVELSTGPQAFPEGACLLLATDMLARGVDFPEIDAVVNFDMPSSALHYVHRMGRTSRAGRAGTCLSFVLERSVEAFLDMVAKVEGAAPQKSSIREADHAFGSFVSELENTKGLARRSRWVRNGHGEIGGS